MDDVFKALADANRRKLLDSLGKKDGQTLGQLCERLPLSRFGTMKHLRVLEAAGLVSTRMQGREKHHFLNPVPIRRIHDRWISKYAAPFVETMVALKSALETPMPQSTLKHVYEVYIRTTPEKLWQALTQSDKTKLYFFDSVVKSSWKANAPLTYVSESGSSMIEGKVLEIDPPKKLVHTFVATWNEEMSKERESRVTWTIEKQGANCKLSLVHEDFDAENATFKSVGPGWNVVLSGLKTLLETGEALQIEVG